MLGIALTKPALPIQAFYKRDGDGVDSDPPPGCFGSRRRRCHGGSRSSDATPAASTCRDPAGRRSTRSAASSPGTRSSSEGSPDPQARGTHCPCQPTTASFRCCRRPFRPSPSKSQAEKMKTTSSLAPVRSRWLRFPNRRAWRWPHSGWQVSSGVHEAAGSGA